MKNMRKGLAVVVLMVVAALVLAACGGGSTSGGGSTGGGAATLTITAKENGCPGGATYCWDPGTLSLNAGQDVNLTVKNPNTNANAHSFEIQGVSGTKIGDIQPGGEQKISFKAPAAGTYTYICDVAGHPDLGMKGTLTVK